MRITKKVFHDLALWMVLFGLFIGVVFPFFVLLLGVPSSTSLTLQFFLACLGAGALAGGINFALARAVVGARLRLLAHRMSHVEEHLLHIAATGDMSACSPEECSVPDDSDDEIGESARAFNKLVVALAGSMSTQSAVRSFSQMLTSQLELESLAQHALDEFIRHTVADGGAMLIEKAGELFAVAAHGIRDPQSLSERDHVRQAVRTGTTQHIRMPHGIRVDGVIADFSPSEVLVLPATYKEIPQGVVILATSGTFDAEARTRTELFRQSLGLALNNAIAHDRLQRLAALDPLTGVYNRRFGMTRLHEEFDRAIRVQSPLGVLMFDIDHFKGVNDTYGHIVGDRMLVSVCGVARTILREGDILIRYGGEEFLALLPAASSEDLRRVGERLRRAIEDMSIRDGSQTIRATISLGAAAYPNRSVEREDDLIALADDALYRAKETGRNRLLLAA